MARLHLLPWPIAFFLDIVLELEFNSPCDCESADCGCDCHLVSVTFSIDLVLEVTPAKGNSFENSGKEEERRHSVVFLKLDLGDEDSMETDHMEDTEHDTSNL